MRIYFVRHGESQANLLRVISNRDVQHGLTERGHQQAEDLAQRLASIPITRIFSSPVLRAVETSHILAQRLQIDYEITPALREFDCGIMEGRADKTAWQAWREIIEAWQEPHNWDQRIAGGESFNDLRARFEPFMQGLISAYRETTAHIICVGHGGLYAMMLPFVIRGLRTDEFKGMAHTEWISAEWREEGLVWIQT